MVCSFWKLLFPFDWDLRGEYRQPIAQAGGAEIYSLRLGQSNWPSDSKRNWKYISPTLVQVMAWRRPGDKPLPEPMMVRLPTHICDNRCWYCDIVCMYNQRDCCCHLWLQYWYNWNINFRWGSNCNIIPVATGVNSMSSITCKCFSHYIAKTFELIKVRIRHWLYRYDRACKWHERFSAAKSIILCCEFLLWKSVDVEIRIMHIRFDILNSEKCKNYDIGMGTCHQLDGPRRSPRHDFIT